ncbi:MAG: alpha/beta hydrolase [Anaerolineae bacterium]|nr:alpha/beta hydrolase [Anaerolineae bacterium]
MTPEITQAMSKGFDGEEGRAALLRILRWGDPRQEFIDYPRIIRAITVPTLVVQGARDVYIPRKQAIRLRDDIPGANLILIPDGGHFLPIDTPEQVAEAINGFVP